MLRKHHNKLRKTVYKEMLRGISRLQIPKNRFQITKSPMENTYKKNGSTICFSGSDGIDDTKGIIDEDELGKVPKQVVKFDGNIIIKANKNIVYKGIPRDWKKEATVSDVLKVRDIALGRTDIRKRLDKSKCEDHYGQWNGRYFGRGKKMVRCCKGGNSCYMERRN